MGANTHIFAIYSKKHQIVPKMERKTKKEMIEVQLCKNCHLFLPSKARSDALFCSNKCRAKWNWKRKKLLQLEEGYNTT